MNIAAVLVDPGSWATVPQSAKSNSNSENSRKSLPAWKSKWGITRFMTYPL